MKRRSFLQTAGFGAAGVLAAQQRFPEPPPAGHAVPEPASTGHPNVLWILGDQFRGQALACDGDPNARTPNLDRA